MDGSRFTPLLTSLSISPSRLTDNLNKLILLGYVKHLSPVERRHPLLPEYVLTEKGCKAKLAIDRIKAFSDLLRIKWALAIVLAVDEGYSQFNEIKKYLGISPKVLSQRLKSLEDEGYLSKEIVSIHPIIVKYRLSNEYKDRVNELR